jgi:hypothetical protein
MNKFNLLNKRLNSLFGELFRLLYNLINNFTINNIYLLTKLINLIKYIIQINNVNILLKLDRIEKKIESADLEIINIFNKIYLKKKCKIILNIPITDNKINYNITTPINSNLDIYDILDITLNIINNNIPLNIDINNIFSSSNNNYIGFKNINIGFDNYYQLHSFKYISYDLPYNILLYINEIDQIVIKVGNDKKYKFINSKLHNVYFNLDNSIIKNNQKYKSILCNNNIKTNKTKCVHLNCKYYHDFFIGYSDNFDKNRSFSSNPIVYNCFNFKDGSLVKGNIKKTNWHDAINIYQSSLSNLLIACMHSQE